MQLHEALQMISGMDESELHDLNRAVIMQIKDRRNRDAREKRCTLKSGDKVSWSGRNGYVEGVVVRVKRKKAIVQATGVGASHILGHKWDVPLAMLKLA
jgi:hypothetical protein